MCRGKSEGGRRCAGCNSAGGRAAHNARRRRNREIKREIVDAAIAAGVADDVVDELRDGPPARAKEWARAHGLSSRLHPGHGHTEAPAAPGDREEGGMTPTLLPNGAGGVGAGHDQAAAGPATRSYGRWSSQLDAQIEHGLAQQGSHRDERNLLDGQVMTAEPIAEGTNTTTKLTLTNGMVGYHKPITGEDAEAAAIYGHTSSDPQQAIHEVAAWRVASQMGEPWSQIVPTCVLREVNGQMGSFAEGRPGVRPIRGVTTTPAELHEAAFFDAVIGQQDRHYGNYLVAGDRVSLIDHGFSFARPGDVRNWSDAEAERAGLPGGAMLTGTEIDICDRFLADETRFGLRGLIEPDRLEAMEGRVRSMRESGRMAPAPALSTARDAPWVLMQRQLSDPSCIPHPA